MIAYPLTTNEQRVIAWGGRLLSFVAISLITVLGALALMAG